MLLRLGGIAITVFWAASMAWLIRHDVWPGLTAGEPPRIIGQDRSSIASSCQAGVFNKYGHRIGTAWSTLQPLGDTARREDVIYVRSFAGLQPTLLEIDSGFTADGKLDEFRLEILGQGMPIEVEGERFGSMYGFNLRVGTFPERIRLDADAAGLIGDAFRPFASLPGLEVGQSWRMQVINPVAILTGLGDRFVPMLVRVTRREGITAADGNEVDCLVVEAPNVTAWVDRDGKVITQQVELPVGGTLTIRDEPYDESAKSEARQMFARKDRA